VRMILRRISRRQVLKPPLTPRSVASPRSFFHCRSEDGIGEVRLGCTGMFRGDHETVNRGVSLAGKVLGENSLRGGRDEKDGRRWVVLG
jgi:hypothetical protein